LNIQHLTSQDLLSPSRGDSATDANPPYQALNCKTANCSRVPWARTRLSLEAFCLKPRRNQYWFQN